MKRSIHIILPAYNEAESLAELLPSLVRTLEEERLVYRIYVVDDGSTDKTNKMVKIFAKKNKRILLISHRRNKGLPEAINTGFRAAISDCGEDDIVITMDADNTHLPGLIMRMVRLIREGHDVVVASRFTKGAKIRGVPFFRKGLSFWASVTFRLLFPTEGVRDYTSGYRAYSCRIIKRAIKKYRASFVDQKGFSCMVDVLLKLRRMDAIFTEVPMILRYDWKGGKSKMRVVETIIETWRLIGKYKLEEFVRVKKRWLWGVLVLLFIFTRAYRLTGLPLFSDEAYAIVKAKEVWETGELFSMVRLTTQPIFIWLVALFQRLPLEIVFTSRLAAGVSGLVTAWLLTKASERYIGKRAGILAFGLMIWLPFSLFYDRTVLFESTTLMFMAGSLFFPVAAVPLAVLTKQIGWLSLPLALGLFVGKPKKWLKILLASVVIPLVVWWVALGDWETITRIIFVKTAAPLGVSVDMKVNLLKAKMWLTSYLTFPVMVMLMVGFVAEMVGWLKKKRMTPLLIVGLWGILVLFFEVKTAKIFYPRYLFPVILPTVLLATKGIWLTMRVLEKAIGRVSYRRVSQLVILGVVWWPSVFSSWNLLLDSRRALVPLETRFQFFQDWTSGVGGDQLVARVIREVEGNKMKTVVYVEEINSYYVLLKYQDNLMDLVEVRIADWLKDPLGDFPGEIGYPGEKVLFVRNRNPDIPTEWPVELLWSYEKTPERKVFLYQIER